MDKLKECPNCVNHALKPMRMTKRHPKFDNIMVVVECYVCSKCGYKTKEKIVEMLWV